MSTLIIGVVICAAVVVVPLWVIVSIMLPFTVRRIRQQGDAAAQATRETNQKLYAILEEIQRTNEILVAVHGVQEE